MKTIRMKVGIGGTLGDHANVKPGDVIQVEDAVAAAWADGVRAEVVQAPKAKAPVPAKKAATKRTAKKGTKTVETAAGNAGPEKR